MKLGIKTTDDIPRLKIKTTDDITKAVECACCVCNPDALWGPGYDDQPSEIQVEGFTFWRVTKCLWRSTTCNVPNSPTEFDAPYCPEGSDTYEVSYLSFPTGDFVYEFLYRNQIVLYFEKLIGEVGGTRFYVGFTAIRTGGDYPAPYGVYTIMEKDYEYAPQYEYNIGDIITIAPP